MNNPKLNKYITRKVLSFPKTRINWKYWLFSCSQFWCPKLIWTISVTALFHFEMKIFPCGLLWRVIQYVVCQFFNPTLRSTGDNYLESVHIKFRKTWDFIFIYAINLKFSNVDINRWYTQVLPVRGKILTALFKSWISGKILKSAL